MTITVEQLAERVDQLEKLILAYRDADMRRVRAAERTLKIKRPAEFVTTSAPIMLGEIDASAES